MLFIALKTYVSEFQFLKRLHFAISGNEGIFIQHRLKEFEFKIKLNNVVVVICHVRLFKQLRKLIMSFPNKI